MMPSAGPTAKRPILLQSLVLAILGILFMLLGNVPMLSADLGPIDDHESVLWQGIDGGLTLKRIPEVVLSTEVGNFGSTTRWRPVGLGLKVAESWMFDGAVPAWYLSRTILLGLAAAGFALGALALLDRALATMPAPPGPRERRWVRAVVPILVLILLQSQPVWEGIANRLGPSENYAMVFLGLGLGTLAIVDARGRPPRPRANGLALGIALLFTALVLTKETLISLGPLVVVAALSIVRRITPVMGLIAVAVAAAGPLLIAAAVGPAMTSGDVYGRGFGPSRIHAAGLVWMRSPSFAVAFLLALGAALYLDRRGVTAGIGLRWWVLASGAAQFIDMFGHDGVAWLRYRLVLDLGFVFQSSLILISGTILLIEAVDRERPGRGAQRWGAVLGAGVVLLAVIAGGFAIENRFVRAEQRAALAADFNAAVGEAAAAVGNSGLVVVILERPDLGEWGVAAARFLSYRFDGVASVVVIRGAESSFQEGEPTARLKTPPVVFAGLAQAVEAGVPTVCLYLLRKDPEPIEPCISLPEVTHR